MKKYGFIYITTNLINGKKYIGKRLYTKGWENYLGSGVRLQYAIKKYGRKNFKREILEECFSEEDLNNAEIRWIMFFGAVESEDFYNIAHGGEGMAGGELHPLYGKKHNEETIKKMSKKAKLRTGEKNPFYGKTHSKETREKLAIAQTNRPKSLKERMDISKRTKGKNNPMYGRKHTEKALEINRQAHLGKKASEQVRKKMSENSTVKRKVICLTTGEIFDSVTAGAKKYDRSPATLTNAIKLRNGACGVDKKGNKLVWAYLDEEFCDYKGMLL